MKPRSQILALATLCLVTAGVYGPCMHGEFQFDDMISVVRDPAAHNLAAVTRALLPSLLSAGHSLATPTDEEGRPGKQRSAGLEGGRGFTAWTFALNYAWGGLNPLGYHVANLVLHLGVTALLFFFTRTLLRRAAVASSAGCALAVASLVALHPLQSQAVCYVTQRSEVIASGAYIGALLLVLHASPMRRLWTAILLVLALAVFAIGLGTKVIVVTMPIAYLLLELVIPDRRPEATPTRWSLHLLLATPFFLLAAWKTYALLTTVKGHTDAGFGIPSLPPSRYFLTQWHVVVTYLRLLSWPWDQNVDWDFPLASGLRDPIVLACGLFLLILVAGSAFALVRWRAHTSDGAVRAGAFGVFWFFLVLAPTSSLVPLADVLMEHRPYLASWGIFLTFVVIANAAITRGSRPNIGRLAIPAGLLCCAFLAGVTRARAGFWRTKVLLWSDAVSKSPNKARAHLGLGNGYREAGQTRRAVEEYQAGLALAGHDPRWIRSDIRGKMATALLTLGRPEDAIFFVDQGLAEDPSDSELLGVLAMAHLRRNELPEAVAAAERSVLGAREPAASFRVLGLARSAMGDSDKAIAAFAQSVRLEPDEEQGRLLLAQAYRAQGRVQESCDVILRVDRPSAELKNQIDEAAKGCRPR